MEYYSVIKGNEFESVLMRWMNLEPIVQSHYTKSEREKQILYTIAYIWNLEKWYWWTYLQGSSGDTDIENRPVDTVGEEEGGWNKSREQQWNIHITVCKIDSQWGLIHDAENPKPVLCDNKTGGMERKAGGRFKRRGHMYTCGWFMLMYGRNHHNVVK